MTPTLQHLDGRPQTWGELHYRHRQHMREQGMDPENICAVHKCRYNTLLGAEYCLAHIARADDGPDRAEYQNLASQVAGLFGTSEREILSTVRRMAVVHARWAIWVGLAYRGWNEQRIAKAARRNKGTVSRGLRWGTDIYETDEIFRDAARLAEQGASRD